MRRQASRAISATPPGCPWSRSARARARANGWATFPSSTPPTRSPRSGASSGIVRKSTRFNRETSTSCPGTRSPPGPTIELAAVVNAFDPWGRDRGEYSSLDWKPRPGAESDPAFRSPE